MLSYDKQLLRIPCTYAKLMSWYCVYVRIQGRRQDFHGGVSEEARARFQVTPIGPYLPA